MDKNIAGSYKDSKYRLPNLLRTYTRYGLYGLILGTFFCLFSLFTNSVPDPSFPWFSIPSNLHLPITQSRIEHWPVTYTVGIWLWIMGFPALFLKGYQWYGNPPRWLIGYPTVAMLGWTTYCRFFWPKLEPATWNAPSYTIVCWFYCSSYEPFWSNVAYGIAALGILGTVAAYLYTKEAKYPVAAFGLLAFPLGIPALFYAFQRN